MSAIHCAIYICSYTDAVRVFEASANLPSFHKVGLFQYEIKDQGAQSEIGSYPVSRTIYSFVMKEEEKTEFYECVRWKFLVHIILLSF